MSAAWSERLQRAVRAPVERDPLRVGVIGTGFGASVHVPALRRVPGVEVRALCGTQRDKLREAAASLAIPRTFTDYRELLDSGEVDAVTIATPPHLHHPMTLAACEAGIHVLCEKPIGRNVAEARDMLRMAREAGICHAIAHHQRYDPARERMQQLIAEGFIGTLHAVSVTVYRAALADPARRAPDWMIDASRGGGILATVGSHYIDALRWWFGEVHAACGAVATAVRERAIAGQSAPRPVDADDNTAFILRFAGGGLASVHLCYTAATEVGEEIIATGSDGMLAIHGDGKLFGSQRGEPVHGLLSPAAISAAERESAGVGRHVRPYSYLAGEWVLAMRTGTDATPSFEDGEKVQEVVDAVTRSLQLSRWIDLSGNKWPV